MGRIAGFLVFILFIVGFEYYSYSSLQEIFQDNQIFNWTYFLLTAFFLFGFFKGITQFRITTRSFGANFIIGLAMTIFVTKLFLALGFALYDVLNVAVGLISYLGSLFSDGFNIGIPSKVDIGYYLVLIFGGIPFLSMLVGITHGKYRYTVTRQKIKINDLPKAFHGFTIAQISDIHSGTFDSIQQVEKGVKLLNDQNADLFVFTGDLINFHKDEIDPYIDTFSKIKAPYGKYSILGNHDYYGIQNEPKNERGNYFQKFAQKHELIGFDLLRNEHVSITKDGESMQLIGVENWGVGGFPKTGDLDKALEGTLKGKAKILLSHDPSHWDHVVRPHKERIDLTLSGHTHGMQFGINLGRFKWSPVQYRYKRWMGLYKEQEEQLYVNRGFGFLGFPGRVFMWPEITIFELEPK